MSSHRNVSDPRAGRRSSDRLSTKSKSPSKAPAQVQPEDGSSSNTRPADPSLSQPADQPQTADLIEDELQDYLEQHEGNEEDEDSAADPIPQAPPNFGPFFSLVQDAQTAEHYHPSVHYVFADDDVDPITSASLRSLGEQKLRRGARHHVRRLSARGQTEMSPSDDEEQGDSPQRSGLPEPPAGKNERYIVVDLAEDGQTVLNARSLSHRWAVTNAEVKPAPMLAEVEGEEHGGSGMMLRVEGTGVQKWDGRGSRLLREVRERRDGDLVGAMEDLVGRIRSEMGVLERIVGSDLDPALVQQEEAKDERIE